MNTCIGYFLICPGLHLNEVKNPRQYVWLTAFLFSVNLNLLT